MTTLRRGLTFAVALAAMTSIFSTAEAGDDENPFAGNWSGGWTIAERNIGGTFAWSISDSGQLVGTVTGSGRSGAIVGHVHEDGKVTMIGFAPGDPPQGGPNGIPFKGTVEMDGDGNLVVTLVGADSDRLLLVAVLGPN